LGKVFTCSSCTIIPTLQTTNLVRERSGSRLGNLYPCVGASTSLGPTESTTTRTWAWLNPKD
jgi:hypothetical protein